MRRASWLVQGIGAFAGRQRRGRKSAQAQFVNAGADSPRKRSVSTHVHVQVQVQVQGGLFSRLTVKTVNSKKIFISGSTVIMKQYMQSVMVDTFSCDYYEYNRDFFIY